MKAQYHRVLTIPSVNFSSSYFTIEVQNAAYYYHTSSKRGMDYLQKGCAACVCGARNPCPGKLGVIEGGALADISISAGQRRNSPGSDRETN
jgi:hypothetical protein